MPMFWTSAATVQKFNSEKNLRQHSWIAKSLIAENVCVAEMSFDLLLMHLAAPGKPKPAGREREHAHPLGKQFIEGTPDGGRAVPIVLGEQARHIERTKPMSIPLAQRVHHIGFHRVDLLAAWRG